MTSHVPLVPCSWLSKACETVGTWSLSPTRHCLDVRPAEAYAEAHVVPSTSIPLNTLESRFSQLPPKSSANSFLIIAEENALFHGQPVGDLLAARGWDVQAVIPLPLSEDEVEEFWDYTRTMGIFGTGKEGTELLFKPSPVLGAWIEWIESEVFHNRWSSVERLVLDVGCGSGRDLGFLAARDSPWSITGLDNWGKALERAEIMVKSINATKHNKFIHAEVDEDSGKIVPLSSTAESNLQTLPKVDLLLIIRFYPRQFFNRVHEYIRPGGYLIFSHFTDPQPGCKDYESPPREKRVQPGEVEDILSNVDVVWDVFQATYSCSEDGRPMWDIVARLNF